MKPFFQKWCHGAGWSFAIGAGWSKGQPAPLAIIYYQPIDRLDYIIIELEICILS